MSAADTIPLMPREQAEREQRRRDSPWPQLWNILDAVMDPEIPVISIWELGILQDLSYDDATVTITITPTYSGCPAMTVIAEDIKAALSAAGYPASRIETRLAPAWTTDWLRLEAREKLRRYGIAPPSVSDGPACPNCDSGAVQQISEFGSTACKALYRCGDCAELFDHFKYL